jgi:hypothetical protein
MKGDAMSLDQSDSRQKQLSNHKWARILLFLVFAVAVLLFTASQILAESRKSAQSSTKELSETVYSDPKGFFRIRPPAGWQVEEYPNDPRGKVKFVCPEDRSITLMVVGMATDMQNFEELLNDSKQDAARTTEKYRAVNATSSTETTTFDNAPAVKGTMTVPGQAKQTSLAFLRGKRYYMLSYFAPLDLYDKYLGVATVSMNSFDPVSKEVTGKDAIVALVASKKRLAELNMQMGFTDVALRAVEEGLAVDPQNQELKDLKQRIARNK